MDDSRKGRAVPARIMVIDDDPSVRGAISGLLRKRLGLTVTQARNTDGERVYRIV